MMGRAEFRYVKQTALRVLRKRRSTRSPRKRTCPPLTGRFRLEILSRIWKNPALEADISPKLDQPRNRHRTYYATEVRLIDIHDVVVDGPGIAILSNRKVGVISQVKESGLKVDSDPLG